MAERIDMYIVQYCQDINSPTDSVIGRDFQELSAEEQERQREEWKAELKKTEEEILTLKQVLTAKERHAAGGQQYYHTYCGSRYNQIIPSSSQIW